MMKLTFHEATDQLSHMAACLQALRATEIAVGLPEGSGLDFILAIQEHGSPVMHIPARPVVKPALAADKTRATMAENFTEAASAAAQGNEAAMEAALASAGQAGAEGIRAYIDAGIAPPNSPVTVSGGWIYNRPARKGVYVSGKGFDKPLYRTGALYNAFSYEVRKK